MGAGLIPAHAGKTLPDSTRSTKGGAHPRSRGENRSRPTGRHPDRGSSPLTRGKPLAAVRWGGGHGLIPAHAGKTMQDTTYATVTRAHPRSRGENCKLDSEFRVNEGSSPLTRGKLSRDFAPGVTRGLIPAHAGKT